MRPSERLREAIRRALADSRQGVRRFEAERGLRPWALRGLLDRSRKQSPSIDKADEICSALGLALQIGQAGAENDAEAALALVPGPLTRKRLKDLEAGARALNQLVLEAGGQPFPAVRARDEVRDLPEIRWIEVRPLAAAAGGGAVVEDEDVVGYLAFRRDWLASRRIDPARCVVIDVMADSMEPTLPEGSAILVDRSRRRRRANHIFVVRTDDGVLVKRAVKDQLGWLMASDNPAYPVTRWTADTEVIGEVRWTARSLG